MLAITLDSPAPKNPLTKKIFLQCTVNGWTAGARSVTFYLIDKADDSQTDVIDAAPQDGTATVWKATVNLRRLTIGHLYTVVAVAKEQEANGHVNNSKSAVACDCPAA